MALLQLFTIDRLHHIERAYVTLAAFMRDFVQRRKQELRDAGGVDEGDRGDIFTRLVAASDGTGKFTLDEQEVVSYFALVTHEMCL